MNKWRPNMWFGVPAHACSGDGCRTCEMYRYYEAGADAMLDALRKDGERVVIGGSIVVEWGELDDPYSPMIATENGTVLFIPDDEVEGTSTHD